MRFGFEQIGHLPHCCVIYNVCILFSEQDDGLDILHQVIKRQKNMAVDIGTEIDRQDGKNRWLSGGCRTWLFKFRWCLI